MAKRGRPSTASLAVATAVKPLEAVPRPDAPYDLTDEQSVEWWAIVNRLPAEWFPRETHALLTQYCRHIVNARRVAQLISQMEQAKDFDISDYDKLLAMQEREGRAINALSRAMRISQQATVRHEQARRPNATKNPWEWQGSE